jgi:hypothetical protein
LKAVVEKGRGWPVTKEFAASLKERLSKEAPDQFVAEQASRQWTAAERAVMLEPVPHLNEMLALKLSDRVAAVTEQWRQEKSPKPPGLLLPELRSEHRRLGEQVRLALNSGIAREEIRAARLDADHPLNQRFHDAQGRSLNDLYANWREKADAHAELTRQRDEFAARRLEQLEHALAETIDEHNQTHKDNPLPHIKVEANADLLDAIGEYWTGSGKMQLPKPLLSPEAAADISNTMMHELIHADQDALMLRYSMERLRKHGLPEDFNNSTVEYRILTGQILTLDWYNKVSRLSADLPALTEKQNQRALELIREYSRDGNPHDEASSSRQTANVLHGAMESLEEGRSVNELLHDLLNRKPDDQLVQRIFGHSLGKEETQLPAGVVRVLNEWRGSPRDAETGLASGFDEQTAQRTMSEFMRGRLRELNGAYNEKMSVYFDSLSEKEAFALAGVIPDLASGARSEDFDAWRKSARERFAQEETERKAAPARAGDGTTDGALPVHARLVMDSPEVAFMPSQHFRSMEMAAGVEFMDRMLTEHIKGWQVDYEPRRNQVAAYLEAESKYEALLLTRARELKDTDTAKAQAESKDPRAQTDVAVAYRALVKAYNEVGPAICTAYKENIESRRRAMQSLLDIQARRGNEVAPQLHLANAFGVKQGVGGYYVIGSGQIFMLDTDMLSNRKGENLTYKLTHERTHFQQDLLIIRHLAESELKLKAGQVPTQAEMAKLQAKFQEMTGGYVLDRAFALRALQSHRSQLSSADGLRAQGLMTSMRQWTANPDISNFDYYRGLEHEREAWYAHMLVNKEWATRAESHLPAALQPTRTRPQMVIRNGKFIYGDDQVIPGS